MPPKGRLPTLLPKAGQTSTGQISVDQNRLPPVSKRKRQAALAACTNCKRRKSKCSSERPACQACQSAGLECKYDVPEGLATWQANREKRQALKKSSANLIGVIDLLRNATEAENAAILERLKSGEDIHDAVNTIAEARILLSGVPGCDSDGTTQNAGGGDPAFLRRANRLITSPLIYISLNHPDYVFEKEYAYSRDQYVEKDSFIDLPATKLDYQRWTSACDDNRLLNHLMTLFWTWDNVVERVLYRPVYEDDISVGRPDSNDAERHQFCSPFLVNALLALSCLYSMDSATFMVPQDPKSRGRHFAKEAEKHFEKEKSQHSIPLLQGQYALFCYEGNLGSGKKSVDWFLRTMETFSALNTPDFLQPRGDGKDEIRLQREKEGISWVMWGLYVMEWRSSLAFGFRKLVRKPIIGKLWRNSNFELSQPNSIGYWWFPYPISLQTQKSLKVALREVDALLSEIVEEILNFLVPEPGKDPVLVTTNPQRAVQLYDALVQWKMSLPPRIRIEEAVLPSAILLHCNLEVLFINLLRPFSHLSKDQFGPFAPKGRCYSHASSLQSAIWTFRAYAILRHEYWLVYALSTAAFVVLREYDQSPAQTEILIKACQCLHDMSGTLPLAIDCLSAINGAFKSSSLQLPAYMMRFFSMGNQHRKDGLMHHTYAALMPGVNDADKAGAQDPLLQELLDVIDGIDID